jgi:hypothetical protein
MSNILILDYQRYYPDNIIGLDDLCETENVQIKDIPYLPDEHTVDEQLHEVLADIQTSKDLERIFIPASLGPVYTDFLGFRLACHIRFTESLGEKRFIPIIIYSAANFQTMFYSCDLIQILKTKGTYLIDIQIEQFLHYMHKDLEKLDSLSELEAVAKKIIIEVPKSYHDSHSLANEWGAYQLDKSAGTNVLNRYNDPSYTNLYFKWLKHIKIR